MNHTQAPDSTSGTHEPTPPPPSGFVAINTISCSESYRERFEALFRSRAHAIDGLPGFRNMVVLKPRRGEGDYQVVSFWDDPASFENWQASPAFLEGHRRGFEDVRKARERGETSPMTSRMETYEILCD